MRSRTSLTAPCPCTATRRSRSVISPTDSRSPWTLLIQAWITRMGARTTRRRCATRLAILTPRRPCPSTCPQRSRGASRQVWQYEHHPRYRWCSLTVTGGGGGRSTTCRRRPPCTPLKRPWHCGQHSRRCSMSLCGRLPPSRVVVLGGALLARSLGPLGHSRFHEGRGRRLLRFQLADACLSGRQGRRQLRHLLL